MIKNRIQIGSLAAILTLFCSAPIAFADESAQRNAQTRVAGEKTDSGLGQLMHYSHWSKQSATRDVYALASHVDGEKLDSGLGELPDYGQWLKHPATRSLVARADRISGEKLDNGLGQLPPYHSWLDKTGGRPYAVEVAYRK